MVLSSVTFPSYFVMWLLPKIGIVITNDATRTIIIGVLFFLLMSKAKSIEQSIKYRDLPEFDVAVREYIFSNVSDSRGAESICSELMPSVNNMLYTQYVSAPKPNHDLPQVTLVVMNCCFEKLNDSPRGKNSSIYADIAKKCLQYLHDEGFLKDYAFDDCVQALDGKYHLYQICSSSLSKKIMFN